MLALETESVVVVTHTTVLTFKSVHFRMVKSYGAGTTPYSLPYPQQMGIRSQGEISFRVLTMSLKVSCLLSISNYHFFSVKTPRPRICGPKP